MTQLRVLTDAGSLVARTSDPSAIAQLLRNVGVRFERWSVALPVKPEHGPEDVLRIHEEPIRALCEERGFATADVIRVEPDHPQREQLRRKFLDEHTHTEDEARFFVRGSGWFSIHVGGHVHQVQCTQTDLLSIPAGTPHWFDMGASPSFTAIRFFTDRAGWVGHPTGSPIAAQLGGLELP